MAGGARAGGGRVVPRVLVAGELVEMGARITPLGTRCSRARAVARDRDCECVCTLIGVCTRSAVAGAAAAAGDVSAHCSLQRRVPPSLSIVRQREQA